MSIMGLARRLVLGLFVLSGSATAVSALPAHGGGGGGPFRMDCGRGVLIGVEGGAGAYVDAVRPVCARVQTTGGLGAAAPWAGKAGGNGGHAMSLRCPPGWGVVGVFGRSGSYVDQLGLHCAPLEVSAQGVAVRAGNTRLGPEGGNGGDPFDDRCPAGQVATGLSGRSGTFVDQLSLLCARVSTAPPPGAVVVAHPPAAPHTVYGHIPGQPGNGKADILEKAVEILNSAADRIVFDLCDTAQRCGNFALEAAENGLYTDCTAGCRVSLATEGHAPVTYDLQGTHRYKILWNGSQFDLHEVQ
jgi:hypothetical protein